MNHNGIPMSSDKDGVEANASKGKTSHATIAGQDVLVTQTGKDAPFMYVASETGVFIMAHRPVMNRVLAQNLRPTTTDLRLASLVAQARAGGEILPVTSPPSRPRSISLCRSRSSSSKRPMPSYSRVRSTAVNPFATARLSGDMEAAMATVQVTEKTFEATVEKGIVLLDFWAAWCGPFRAFAPVFEAAASRHPGVVFGKVDTEAEPGLAAAFEILAIPTLALLRDGVLLIARAGVVSGDTLDELIRKAQAVDMTDVRKHVEDQPNAEGGILRQGAV